MTYDSIWIYELHIILFNMFGWVINRELYKEIQVVKLFCGN